MSNPYPTDDGDHSPPKQQAAATPSASRNIPDLVIADAEMDSYQGGSVQDWPPPNASAPLQNDAFFTGNYYIDPSLGEIQDISSFEHPEQSEAYDQNFLRPQSRLATLRSHSQTQSYSTTPDTDSEPPRIPLLPPVATQSAERLVRHLKRRQQNRSAQRAFRERKESYTNRLENEVTALRAKYDALVEALSGFREAFLDIERIIEGHRAGSPASGEVEDLRGKGKGRGFISS